LLGTLIDGEVIGHRQLKDLNRARAFLCDIAARHQKYCDVFDSVENVKNKENYKSVCKQCSMFNFECKCCCLFFIGN
jgi:hypothetical protein